MVTIEQIIAESPHLKDSLRLYEKVMQFESAVHDLTSRLSGRNTIPITLEHVSYPAEYVPHVFDLFSSILDVPADMLAPLREAMELGRIDLTRLPLNEVPAFSLPYQEQELATILFLIGRPYYHWLRKKFNLDNMFWQEGKCPACNSAPVMAAVKSDEKKSVFCPYCGSRGFWKRIGCPACQNEDAAKLEIFLVEDEEGYMINLCNECNSYHKTVKASLLDDYTPELLDIISMPLDVVAQGKGYRRLSPNPLGMTVMA